MNDKKKTAIYIGNPLHPNPKDKLSYGMTGDIILDNYNDDCCNFVPHGTVTKYLIEKQFIHVI